MSVLHRYPNLIDDNDFYDFVDNVRSNSFMFGSKSQKQLRYVHPVMRKVIILALSISDVDFSVNEGLRNLVRQKNLIRKGYSKTMNSYHLYGLAFDIVPYVRGVSPWDLKDSRITIGYAKINLAIKEAMELLGMEVVENGFDMWGWDYPHWQMTRTEYNSYNPRKFYKNKKFIGFR